MVSIFCFILTVCLGFCFLFVYGFVDLDFTTYSNNNHNMHDGGVRHNNLNSTTTSVFTKSTTVPLQLSEQQQIIDDRNADVTTPDFEECFGVAANETTTTTVATSNNDDDKDDDDADDNDDNNVQNDVKKQTLIQHPIFMTNKNSDSDLVSGFFYLTRMRICMSFFITRTYTRLLQDLDLISDVLLKTPERSIENLLVVSIFLFSI